jgi:hypothetical protein
VEDAAAKANIEPERRQGNAIMRRLAASRLGQVKDDDQQSSIRRSFSCDTSLRDVLGRFGQCLGQRCPDGEIS